MKTKSIVINRCDNNHSKCLQNRTISSIDENFKNERNDRLWIFKENSEIDHEYEFYDISFVGVWKEIMQFAGYIKEFKNNKMLYIKVKLSIRF